MFFNQIKHIVGLDSRTTRDFFVNLLISANFYFYSRNVGEFDKKIVILRLFQSVYDNAHSYRVMIKKHVDKSIEPP